MKRADALTGLEFRWGRQDIRWDMYDDQPHIPAGNAAIGFVADTATPITDVDGCYALGP